MCCVLVYMAGLSSRILFVSPELPPLSWLALTGRKGDALEVVMDNCLWPGCVLFLLAITSF